MLCPECGAELRLHPLGTGRCPECCPACRREAERIFDAEMEEDRDYSDDSDCDINPNERTQ